MKLAVYLMVQSHVIVQKIKANLISPVMTHLKRGGAQELQILGVIGINSLFYQLTVTTYTL